MTMAPAATPIRTLGPEPGLILPRPLGGPREIAMTPEERQLTVLIHAANRHQPTDLPIHAYRGVPVRDWRRSGRGVEVSEKVLGIRDKGNRKWLFGTKNQTKAD